MSELRGDFLIGILEHGANAHPRRVIVRSIELSDEMGVVSRDKRSR